jgi:ribosome-associated toxin RatA of RatAB toxin-antitoxin module
MPHLSAKLREGDSYIKVGALVDNIVGIHGKFPIKFTTKTVEVKNNEMIRVDYVKGAFRGEGLWKFESLDSNTKLSYRWRTSPSGLLLRIMAPFLPVKKSHSDFMKAGYEGLNRFLE